VLTNDAGSSLTVTRVGTPAHGTATIAPDGSWTYTPPVGWGGTDTFTYTATDGSGQTTDATVTVRVDPPTPPAATDDTATGVRDQPTTLTELTNDTPGDNLAWDLTTVRLTAPGTGLPVSTVTVPGEGTWTVEPGQVRFTPVPGFHGDAHLGYQVTNTAGQTVRATMTVTYPPMSQLTAPPVVVVPTSTAPTAPTAPAAPTAPHPAGLVVTVTVKSGGPAGLATTGADPYSALLLAFSLVVAGMALSVGRRRLRRD
jgi:CshA-type fibril repeat protein